MRSSKARAPEPGAAGCKVHVAHLGIVPWGS